MSDICTYVCVFTVPSTLPQATKYIFGMKCKLSEMKEREDSIRRGLNIFKIEQPPSNSIQQMEKVGPYLSLFVVVMYVSLVCVCV